MENASLNKDRDYYFDNLRGIYIFLVVLGHFIGPLGQVYGIRVLYRYIYIFHMPGMLFISGFFFKTSIEDGKLVKNKFFNYIVLYAVFQMVFTVINHSKFSMFQSQMGLWYLQVLAYYTLLTPMLVRLKSAWCLRICFLLGILVGMDESAGHVGSLSRFMVFLPFFMIGYYVDRSQIERFFEKKYIALGITMLVIIAAGLYIYMGKVPELLNLSSGKFSYSAMKMDCYKGIVYRTVWYVLSLSMICFVAMVTPRKKCMLLSNVGRNSLQVFLLHLIIVIMCRRTNLFLEMLKLDGSLVIALSVVAAAVITIVTSLRFFSYPFDYIMGMKFKWLLRTSDEDSLRKI